jgi:phage shock protein E
VVSTRCHGGAIDHSVDALIIASLVVLVLFLVFGRPKPDIDGDQARALVKDEGARLLDVRTDQEFSAGHIDGAINIPMMDLDGRLDELGDKSEPVVVYCQSGMRSSRAKKMLEAAGFERVHDLGGRRRW